MEAAKLRAGTRSCNSGIYNAHKLMMLRIDKLPGAMHSIRQKREAREFAGPSEFCVFKTPRHFAGRMYAHWRYLHGTMIVKIT